MMNPCELGSVAERFKADLYLPTGERSGSPCWTRWCGVVEDGRPVRSHISIVTSSSTTILSLGERPQPVKLGTLPSNDGVEGVRIPQIVVLGVL
jgi:hypothetical protein